MYGRRFGRGAFQCITEGRIECSRLVLKVWLKQGEAGTLEKEGKTCFFPGFTARQQPAGSAEREKGLDIWPVVCFSR